LAAHLDADHAGVAIRSAVGQHAAVGVDHPQVEVHGVAVEDHPEPLAGVGRAGRVGFAHGFDHGRIGGPPAHVARALVEVAIDDVDQIERQVGQPLCLLRLHALQHVIAQLGQPFHLGGQVGGQRVGQLADLR
jgi:hypothetical protein